MDQLSTPEIVVYALIVIIFLIAYFNSPDPS
jgi:hypothetical protein